MQFELDPGLIAPAARFLVTFSGGSLHETGHVLFAATRDNQTFVVTDRTPFHPVSLRWPDQPGDQGKIAIDGKSFTISDAWTGLIDRATSRLVLADDAAGMRPQGDEIFSVVVHVIDAALDVSAWPGKTVELTVDKQRRHVLSAPHTAVHLAALALNQVAGSYWTKPYDDLDGLGHANLDKAAVSGSLIAAHLSTDHFRLGKSLKKKGFNRDGFLAELAEIAVQIEAQVSKWLASGAAISVTPAQSGLDDVRIWHCALDGRTATIPCGGTHVASLSEIGGVNVKLMESEDGFTMTTTTQA